MGTSDPSASRNREKAVASRNRRSGLCGLGCPVYADRLRDPPYRYFTGYMACVFLPQPGNAVSTTVPAAGAWFIEGTGLQISTAAACFAAGLHGWRRLAIPVGTRPGIIITRNRHSAGARCAVRPFFTDCGRLDSMIGTAINSTTLTMGGRTGSQLNSTQPTYLSRTHMTECRYSVRRRALAARLGRKQLAPLELGAPSGATWRAIITASVVTPDGERPDLTQRTDFIA